MNNEKIKLELIEKLPQIGFSKSDVKKIVKAFELQIPAAPEESGNSKGMFTCYYCRTTVGHDLYNRPIKDAYCRSCGKKVDWSDSK